MSDMQISLAAALVSYLFLCVVFALRQAADPGPDAPDELYTFVDFVLMKYWRDWRIYPAVDRSGAEWPRRMIIRWGCFCFRWYWSVPTDEQLKAYRDRRL